MSCSRSRAQRAVRDVQRAQILLRWVSRRRDGKPDRARSEATTRKERAQMDPESWRLQMGVKAGMKDASHKPRKLSSQTMPGAPSCASGNVRSPKIMGYACRVMDTILALKAWQTYAGRRLRQAFRKRAAGCRYKATVQRILKAQELQPHTVRYYLERRDPEFERKRCGKSCWSIAKWLCKTKLPARGSSAVARDHRVGGWRSQGYRLSKTPALRTCRRYPANTLRHSRDDHEYIRHGTLSILASLDLS